MAWAGRPLPPWTRVVLAAAGMWLATRLAYVALTYLAVVLSAPGRQSFPPDLLLQRWQRLDTKWYIMIAHYGYWTPTAATFARDGGQMPTAFFPLYPVLIAAMSHLLGDTQRILSALLVANLGTLLAFVGVGLLAAGEDWPEAGPRAVRVGLAYPLAFFLTAGYSDGLFFGLAAFTLFFARRGRWYPAMICALLAGLTRITALVLILPLAWEYVRQQGWLGQTFWRKLRLRLWRTWARLLGSVGTGALVVAAAPLGLGIYMRYLAVTFHDPLTFVHAEQRGWYHVSLLPWQSFGMNLHNFTSSPAWSYPQAQQLVNTLPVVIFALLTLVAARRMPMAFTLYMLGLLYVSIASPTVYVGNTNIFSSAGRFLIPAAPIYLVLARWTEKRPALHALVVDGGLLVQATLATLWLAVGAYII